MTTHLESVSSDYIRYANCWEDADVLLAGLNLGDGRKILSVGSAGDNSFSLLTTSPELLIAADLNIAQLHLIRLKMIAISLMEREDFLAFAGFSFSTTRLEQYALLRSNLPRETQLFWDSKQSQIEQGIIHSGKFENYFSTFRRWVLPLIHNEKRIHQLFDEKESDEQRKFYQEQWETFLWKLLFKVFFSKMVMGRYGRDKAFLKEVEVSVKDFIFEKAKVHLSETECQKNYFLKYILLGNHGTDLPHYVREENYYLVKENLAQMKLEMNYFEQVGLKYGYFDALNGSNIFEYMPMPIFEQVGTSIAAMMNNGARIAYWNLMVPRCLSDTLHNLFEDGKDLVQARQRKDKGFFYNAFHLDQKQ